MGRVQNFGGPTNEWIVPMSCWPPCSGWCECVGNECRQAPLKPNAVRIRTDDGRYLRAINGPTTYLGYLGPTSNVPGTWDTFLIDQPMAWPVRSGDLMVLHAIDNTWRPLTDVLVRVDHGVRTLPQKGKKDPQLVSYQFGGPDRSVLVSSPLSPGYPAYAGNDPGEWTFTITKIEGGNPAPAGKPINTGDQVTFSFFSRNPAQPERSWRLRDDTSPRRVDGDAAPGGPAATVFTVEFSEVGPTLAGARLGTFLAANARASPPSSRAATLARRSPARTSSLCHRACHSPATRRRPVRRPRQPDRVRRRRRP